MRAQAVITLYRISPARDWRESAHRPAAARWHTHGQDVLYTSSHCALAVLEALAHLAEQPVPHYLIVLRLPSATSVLRIDAMHLDPRWKHRKAITRRLGDGWLRGGESALLRVPSVHAPDADNILLNPAHPDAKRLRIEDRGLFRFATRLRRGVS